MENISGRKANDLTGRKFGCLLVIKRTNPPAGTKKPQKPWWECLCDCGNSHSVRASHLVDGNISSCGDYEHKIKDFTGEKFGKLTVIRRTEKPSHLKSKNKMTYWECQCECGDSCIVSRIGLVSDKRQSCGCIKSITDKSENITNQRFGKLIAIERSKRPLNSSSRGIYWRCICDCGKEVIVRFGRLKSNKRKACGNKCPANWFGKTFNRLTIIGKDDKLSNLNGHIYFVCQCVCGNTTKVLLGNLKHNKVKSCGCLRTDLESSNEEGYLTNIKIVYNRYTDGDPPLSLGEFIELSKKPCYYCGCAPYQVQNRFKSGGLLEERKAREFTYNGLDRIDSSLPHSKDNVVACCGKCNRMKSNYDIDDFMAHINSIYQHRIRKSFNDSSIF